MTKLLKRRRPESSGHATGTPAASGTSAPAAGSPRGRSYSLPGLVRRLLRKLRPRHSQPSYSNDLEEDGVLVSVTQGVSTEVLNAEAVAARRAAEVIGNAGWRLSAPSEPRRWPPRPRAQSVDSSLEYMDDPAIPAAPELPSIESEESQPIVHAKPGLAHEGAVSRAPPSPIASRSTTIGTPYPALALVKDMNAERPQMQATITGSETTGLDARSSFDPGSCSQSVGSSSSKHFSVPVQRPKPVESSVFVESLSPPSNAVPAPVIETCDAPINKIRGRRPALDPYMDPYVHVPEDNRLTDCVNEDGERERYTYVWRTGQHGQLLDDCDCIFFVWKGIIGGGQNGKVVYGASTDLRGSTETADSSGSLAWFPPFVAVKMVSKVDLFTSRHAGSVYYGSVVNEAAAMKALSSQPSPSAFVNGALAVFQDDNFFYTVSVRRVLGIFVDFEC
ncbi:hypothetical protein PENSPDRAFT_47045 [Peniophora sp. CONT]|nr:hypothetical protein PENSPDRAFT_47045 [Peniophora sp. CONT]